MSDGLAPPEPTMQPLDRRYLNVIRVATALSMIPLVVAGIGLDVGLHAATGFPFGGLAGLAALLAVFLAFTMPGRRYRAWGYALDGRELAVTRGVLVRTHAVVPLQRVQHIDLSQGPLDRRFGLAEIVVHTAGTAGPAVTVPGLDLAEAERLRDTIRRHIRREDG